MNTKKNIVSCLLFLVVLSLAAPALAGAQEIPLPESEFAMFVMYAFGLEMPLMSELNAAFTQNGYDKIDFYELFSYGMHYYMQLDNFVTGVDTFRIRNSDLFDDETSTSKLKLHINYTYFNLGFAPVSTRAVTIFSLLGIGANKSTMYVYDTATDSFLSFLANPTGSSLFSSLNFALKGTLGLALTFLSQAESRFTIAITGHYHLIPFPIRWKIFNDIDITDVPESFRHAFNVNIGVGIASR